MVTNNHINYSNEKMVVLSLRMNKMFLQSFHDMQMKPIYMFLQGKVLFAITCRRRYCEIILRRL